MREYTLLVRFVCSACIVGMLLPGITAAHLPAWTVIQSAGEYDVSLSLSDPSPAEENLVSIALLRREPTVMFEDFDTVSLQVTEGDDVLLDETLRQEAFGRAWTTLVFPGNGTYSAAVTVQRDGQSLAETVYTVRIGRPMVMPWMRIALLLAGCMVAIVVVRWTAGRT